jgi:hypothetical protein
MTFNSVESDARLSRMLLRILEQAVVIYFNVIPITVRENVSVIALHLGIYDTRDDS